MENSQETILTPAQTEPIEVQPEQMAETEAEAEAEAGPEDEDAFIQLQEAATPMVALAAPITDEKPADFIDPVEKPKTAWQLAEEKKAAEHNRIREEFFARRNAQREKDALPPPKPQPVPPAVAERTRLEMEEGARRSAAAAQFHAVHPQKPPTPHEIHRRPLTPPRPERDEKVFTPGDYTHEKGVGIRGKGHSSAAA